MQAAAGGGAGTGNIAAVLGNFRFNQDDIQHIGNPPRVSGIIVFQMAEKFNYKMVEKLQKN